MEIRRFGDSLLRSRPCSPFLQLLAPSPSQPRFLTREGYSSHFNLPNLKNSQRSAFATYPPIQKAYGAAAAIPESESDQSLQRGPVDPRTEDDYHTVKIGHILDEVGVERKDKFNRDRNSPIYAPRSRPQRSSNAPAGNSADIMKNALSDSYDRPWRSGAIHTQMEMPSQPPPGGAENGSGGLRRTQKFPLPLSLVMKPRAVRTIKSSPSVGRTVEVNRSRSDGLSQAIRKMEISCHANNVRRDQMKQRFHERPGMRRKRLKSERWRARFKLGFQALVGKVQAMRRQGW